MTDVHALGQCQMKLKEDLKRLIEMAYDKGAISRTQDTNEVVYTIRIPHVKTDHPNFDLFRFAAELVT